MKQLNLKVAVVAILALVVLLATMPASGAGHARAYVPFAFDAGKNSLPAGHYVVERSPNGGMIYLSNIDKNDTVALITVPTGNPNSVKNACLVFEKLGGAYRLAEVWTATGGPGNGIPRTSEQMLIAREQGQTTRIEVSLGSY